jgi:hypothetical protein
MQRLFNRIKSILIGCCLVLGLLFVGASPVQAQVASELPVATDSAGRQTPAWDQVSFSSLPTFDSAGVLNVPEDATGYLDYTLSRSWQAGDSVLNVLKLGDVQDAFALGNFKLGDAVRLGGLDPATLSLSNFSFLQTESIADLVTRIPAIAGFRISEVRPLYDLITQRIPNVAQTLSQIGNFRVWSEQPIATLARLPEIGNLSLNDLDLSQYSFTQLPGLEQATLSSIRDWKNLNLAQIPGLGNVPFSAFFNPGQFLGLIAIHDMTYGGDTAHKESRWTPTKHSITGSYEVGFNYECAQARGCDYLELNSPISLGTAGDPTGLHGARWIRGGSGAGEQMVKGGHGVLGMFNGSQEPTGRHPFSKAFKVVLTNTDESTGTGRFGLYFRVCYRTAFVDLGCTPYFIGPVPWFPTHEKGIVLVGLTEMAPPDGIEQPPIPGDIQDIIDQAGGDDSQTCSVNATQTGRLSDQILRSMSTAQARQAAPFMPAIIRACSAAGITDANQLAYVLATAEHESDHYNTTDEYSRHHYDECGWGEGLIQVTWCSNKRRVFQRLGLPAYGGISDRRLHNPTIAAQALCRGMKEGWYTATRLGQCISGSQVNLRCARSIVNGDYDRVGTRIDGYFEQLRRVLQRSSGTSNASGSVGTCQTSGSGSPGVSTGRMIYPVGANAPTPRNGEYGNDRGDHMHAGVDFAMPLGTPIKAADGGEVVTACIGCDPDGYGALITIRHANGLETRYAHVNTTSVRVGQRVSQGQVIGTVGSRGRSSGPHLHFEVRRNGNAVNPMPYLRRP